MNTLITVAAIGVIGLGEPGVGTLNAVWGLGGLVGAVAAVSLANRRELGPAFAVSLVLWGFPLAAIGLLPWPVVAFAAMFVSGVGNATLDISAFPLLQRTVPSADRMAVFVLLEALVGLGLGLGSILAPLLLVAFGDRGALAIAGAIMPIVAVATWRWIHRVDEEAIVPTEKLAILRGAPMFARLPMTALERLAEGMRSVSVEPGAAIVREGEIGDAYLIVERGRVAVSQAGQQIGELGPGEGFGEIALLHAMPRTATVRALVPSAVYSIAGPDFLEAIAGPTSTAVATRVAAEHLARTPSGDAGAVWLARQAPPAAESSWSVAVELVPGSGRRFATSSFARSRTSASRAWNPSSSGRKNHSAAAFAPRMTSGRAAADAIAPTPRSFSASFA